MTSRNIDLAGIFQDHINPSLQKGFCLHYPNYGHSCLKAAITQRSILVNMLKALIKAKNDVTNICEIARVEQLGGVQFHPQAHPSIAEKTFSTTAVIRCRATTGNMVGHPIISALANPIHG